MPWYSKSISLFPPADCYIISSNLSYTVEIAPAVTSLVLVVLCFKPFRKLPLYFNDVKIIPLAIIQAEFLEEIAHEMNHKYTRRKKSALDREKILKRDEDYVISSLVLLKYEE